MRKFVFLKWLRTVISLVFFILIFFLFIDFANTLSVSVISGLVFFQFVPSVIKFINLSVLLTSGFIFVLLLTVFFGRIYCSVFCPLGTLQDIASYISRKVRKKGLYRFSKPNRLVRYSFFIITITSLLSGTLLIVSLLDPFSLFGKIVSDIFRPVYYGLNNAGVYILEKTDIYSLYPVKLKGYSLISSGFSVFMLIVVVYFAIGNGRLYCNTICPVGTFLGIVAGYSIFKIKLDDIACNSCGKCGANCKSGCIDTKNKKVDFSRCVGCFNCLTVCPGNGVKFSNSYSKLSLKNPLKIKSGPDNRRQFLIRSATLATGVFVWMADSWSQAIKNIKIPVTKKYPVTPPGSVGISHFHSNCTSCHLCISACPTHVLQPSITQYGWDGLFQPVMNYKVSFCNYECVVCSAICPTGAILPVNSEEKKLIQVGITNFIRENCVVYTDETACGACSEHCPTKAVNMVLYKGKLKIPAVTQEICVGCGACEYACPTIPKSIYVDGNPVHLVAEKPKESKSEIKIKPEEDFPF